MAPPTDDELEQIGLQANYAVRDTEGRSTGESAERRALYEAGEAAGYRRGYFGCVQDLRAHEAARIVAGNLDVPLYMAEDALSLLADRITKGEQ